MAFKDPWILILIPICLALVTYLKRRQKPSSFRFSSVKLFDQTAQTWKQQFHGFPHFLRLCALVLFLFSLAGPRSVLEETITQTEGIDIVLAIDASGSMAAEDFVLNNKRVNRLEIVKDVVREFVKERRDDRLGLVAFSGLAYTVCPLTTDHGWLDENLSRVELGIIKDGTAIGAAIASALSRLKASDAKSKIIILLTDGVNNVDEIDPIAAARAAEAFDIKIYTIGAGSKGYAPFPVKDVFGRTVYQRVMIDIDEKTLTEIANITGGEYFRATDAESLKDIYKRIDRLEKTEIEEFGFREYKEMFPKFLTAALLLLIVELTLSNTIFLKIP